jgi:protocatechuate 3,4-dioxygenase beta subunit
MTAVLALILTLAAPQSAGGVQTQTQTQTSGPPRTPPRDASAAEKKGTGVIRGKITNTEGRPLRRVQVRLSGESIPEGRLASTNGLGKFEIRDLPAGRFTLNASRAGYLAMSFGQTRIGEPGRPIELADAETLEKSDMILPHAALISGHVLDEAGEPLAGANVMTMQMKYFNGRRRLLPVRGNTITDNTGQYRLSGLEPGEYYVQASSRETWETDPPDKQMLGFLPTFYPSSPNQGEAQRVRVRAGQEAPAIDIALLPGKVGKVSGTAFNSQGGPLAGENVNLSFEIRGENFMMMSGGESTKVNPDGTFTFRNIAPAEYHLNVRTTANADRPAEAANVIVSVIGGDVEGVNIVTSAAGSVIGRVTVDGSVPFPNPLTKLSVRALPVDRDTAINSFGFIPDNGRVKDDGTFELKQVVGSNRLSIGTLPEGWAIRSIDHNGRDLTTQPIDTQGTTLDGVAISLTSKFPVLSGSLRDDKGNSAVTGTVIIFPEDASAWAEDLRTVRTGRADQTGLFTIKAIRPGEYLAVAVPTVQNNQWNDPEFLETLRAQAKRVSLRENETKQIELIIKAPGAY